MAPAVDPHAIGESTVLRRRTGVGTVAVGPDAVLVDEAGGRAHAVNSTGALIWECLDGQGDLAGLVDDLAEGFGTDRAVVAADVRELVHDLAGLGLIEGYDAEAHAWPAEFLPFDGGDCLPDPDSVVASDERYLAAPPNT